MLDVGCDHPRIFYILAYNFLLFLLLHHLSSISQPPETQHESYNQRAESCRMLIVFVLRDLRALTVN